MADPFYDQDLVEESLWCAIKRTKFMVSNDLNTPRVTGCWPQKPLPLSPDPPSVEEDLKKSFSPVWIGLKSIYEPVTSEATSSWP